MMHRALQIVFFLLSGLVISSCVTTNHVVSNSIIQKRKYNTGWFVKNRSHNTAKSSDIKVVDNSSRSTVHNETNGTVVNPKLDPNHSTNENSILELSNADSISNIVHPNFISDQILEQSIDIIPKPHEEVIQTEKGFKSQPIVNQNDEQSEEKNKVAVYGFSAFLAAILFIAIGFPMALAETYFILILGLTLLLASIILSILALTKYKHQKKRKVFAKITLLIIVFVPLLTLIFSFVWFVFGGGFTYSF